MGFGHFRLVLVGFGVLNHHDVGGVCQWKIDITTNTSRHAVEES